ncbi:MAG: MFS transporter [Gammaproteobacteria bacterium]|nr:MAG: MFS transporter [Gammaproteobacteria bacterium]
MPILLSTILMSGLGFGLVLPAFLFFAENLGASPAVATTIIGTFAVGQFLSTPVWGRLSDRFGRKPILVISLLGQAASYLLLAFADNLWMMAIARSLNGLTSGNLPVAMAYVSDVTPPEKRAGGMGMVGGAISLGFIVGPAIGGLLGGSDAASASLFWPGIAAASVCALTAVAGILFLRESLPPEKRSHAEGKPREGGFAAARRVFRRPILAQMVLAGFLVYLGMALFETIFPLWSGARYGWGPREVGLSFTYLGLLVGTVQGVLVGRLVPRFGEGRLVTFGLACYPVGLLIMTQAPTWPLMMAGITFTAGGGALFITTMSSLVSHQAAEQERGLVMGVYQSGSWMGRAIGPPVAGILFGALGVNSPLFAAALIILPALAMVALIRRRTAPAGEP